MRIRIHTYIHGYSDLFGLVPDSITRNYICLKKKRMVGNGARVLIPAGAMKTVESIKEITANNYSEDEIHALLLK